MTTTLTQTEPSARNSRGKVIIASLIGTSIEFYDFYIYATAAVLIFPALFFPDASNSTTAQLSSFAVFGVAFLARPIGSLLFGHLGDRIGRKGTLVGSLLTMGIATVVIGLLPTALTPGWAILAPLALVICRMAQGIGLGGEWSGAALLATENAPEGKRAVYGTFPQLGAPIGFIVANLFMLVLSQAMSNADFMSYGWRIPFIASAVLVMVGLYVRISLIESPAFTAAKQKQQIVKMPLLETVRTHPVQLVLATFNMVGTYCIFYLLTTFVLTFGTTPSTVESARAAAATAGKPFNAAAFVPGLGYTREQFILMLVISCVCFGIFTFLAGPLAERFGRRSHLLVVTIGIVVYGLVWSPLLQGGTVGVMIALMVGFALTGLSFGPMGALLPEMFATNVRYTGSAVAYNMASILGAAIAPFISIALWSWGEGSPFWVGVYLSGVALLTVASLALTRETRNVDYVGNASLSR
ncbi:MFS transporter [Devriesea agamarum]|uniref:MFS transporter n=1 Tax=Devriesea agamarum TaxID=472569 RepID=UPI00071D8716|nr:MFS transporter [Devriesea agamarum]